jgi:hypothetical protein
MKLLIACVLVCSVALACDCNLTLNRLQVVNIIPITVNNTYVESESLMANRTDKWLRAEQNNVICIQAMSAYYVPMSMQSMTWARKEGKYNYDDNKLDYLPTAWTQYYDDDDENNDQRSRKSLMHCLVYKYVLCIKQNVVLSDPNIDPGYVPGKSDLKPVAFGAGHAVTYNLLMLVVLVAFSLV